MKKRFTALLIVAALTVSIFNNVCGTVSAEENTQSTELSSSDNSYINYYDKLKNIPFATDTIIMNAADYSLNDAAQLALFNDDKNENGSILWSNGEGKVSWNFSVPQKSLYSIGIRYQAVNNDGNDISLNVLFDGKVCYDELKSIELKRLWEDNGDVRVSSTGNQVAASQKEKFAFSDTLLTDSTGLSEDPLVVCLDAGSHVLTIECNSEPVILSKITLAPPQKVLKYKDALAKYKKDGAKDISGDVTVIEGEDAFLKSSKSLVAKCDNTEVSLSPSDPSLDVVNYIGSTNWENIGDAISWKVNVSEDGLYKLGFHYRQSYILGGNSYRSLKIDGTSPFEEAKRISFSYNSKWQYSVFEQDEDNPYYFYLTKGEHTISLTVTMGAVTEVNARLTEAVLNLGKLYRQIVMITGETPDSNRDYNLFGQIPDFEKNLTSLRKELNELASQLSEITVSKSNSQISVIKNMAATIDRILKHPYQATDYKSDFYSNYGSLGTILYEMRQLPLDIDTIQLIPSESKLEKKSEGLFSGINFSVKRFVSSFVNDYGDISGEKSSDKEITIWLNWGRDQVQVLNNFIDELFTPQYGIDVNVKIVNASLIQAMLSNNGPDLALRLTRSFPVDYAMRGALYNLKNFNDYDEVMSRFMDKATVPYEFNDGCYAIPDTQNFYVTFYRKDVLDEIGLQVPKTWSEFIRAVSILARNNMQVGIPYTQISSVSTTDAGIGALNLYPTVLLQHGGSLYNENHTSTNLTSTIAIQAFKFWTDLYTKYSLPVTYDFYNRFRSGEMPLAIQQYSQYATISAAALEINGLWGMAEIPGFEQEDGTINNIETGGGTGSVILNQSKHKDEAWEFLKWWTSADVQVRYINELESILGSAERQTTANVEALKKLAWDKDDIVTLTNQWKKVEELPEVPGGYYTARCVEQAYWNVVNRGANSKSTIVKWGKLANLEIQRKRAEYHLDD